MSIHCNEALERACDSTASRVRPFVSIIVLTRNEERTLRHCVTSLLEQDYEHYEVIVVDAGSTDGTEGILDALAQAHPQSHRLHILQVRRNNAPEKWADKCAALRSGLLQADGEWVLVTHPGTCYASNTLSMAIIKALDENLDLLYSERLWMLRRNNAPEEWADKCLALRSGLPQVCGKWSLMPDTDTWMWPAPEAELQGDCDAQTSRLPSRSAKQFSSLLPQTATATVLEASGPPLTASAERVIQGDARAAQDPQPQQVAVPSSTEEAASGQAAASARPSGSARSPDQQPVSAVSSPPRQRKQWRWSRRRVPVLHQVSMVECGAACLAMILSYYGRKTTIAEIHDQCGLGRDGLSARQLVEAARKVGMRVRPIALQENDFRFVSLPAIVHWEFNHFLVVERWSPRWVQVVDPAVGRRRLSSQEFAEGFTGVVLMLEPGVHFARENTPAQLRLRSYVSSYLKQAPLGTLQVVIASLLLQALGLLVPLLTKVAVDQLIPLKMYNALTLFGLGIILLVLSQFVLRLLRASVLLYVQTRVDVHMLLNFFEHLLSLPHRFFLQRSSGDLLSRIGSNLVIRDTISNQLFSTLLDGSFVITYFIILLTQSLLFSSLVLVMGALQVILLLGTTGKFRELTSRELAAQGKSQGYLTEALTGIKALKAAGAEQRVLERWSNLFLDQMNISVRLNYVTSLVGTALATLSLSAPLALLWVGTLQVIAGTMQVGSMLALTALAQAILTPLASLVLAAQQLQVVRSHLDRLADVVQAEPEQQVQAVAQAPDLRGEIRLEQLSFQYDPNSPMVLRDINVQIKPGQKVALVGRSGSGKSTLGSLLLGLYLPSQGEIYYDGLPLRSFNYQQVRAQFGVVTQEATVFSGSIRENIALHNASMSMEQVIRAAQLAALHDDIMQMPMQYETLISEAGNGLSGGQRQRLALARALAHSPAILLMDEATSSLDVVTERVVEQNIRQYACTQIIIAHRLSTIRDADEILVLDQGTIVERGSHEELLGQQGYYAKLIKNQLAPGGGEGHATEDAADCAHRLGASVAPS